MTFIWRKDMTGFAGNIKQEKVTVGDKNYLIQSWNVIKAIQHFPTIGKAFAVPLSFLYSSMGDEQALRDAIPQAFFMLFEQLEQQDVMELFNLILSGVSHEGQPLNIDTHLANIDELFQLAAKALEINYGCLMNGKGFKNLLGVMVPMHQMTAQA
tara:strand:- start:329 stop:793 length:465 start_codon:yes stop_codon:yes gene_type:complete